MLKQSLKKITAKALPLSLKKKLYDLWKETSDEFFLYSKMAAKSYPDNLVKARFIWADLEEPVSKIKKRFGESSKIYLMTDRVDVPTHFEFINLTLHSLESLNLQKEAAIICAFNSDELLLEALKIIKNKKFITYFTPSRYAPTSHYFHKNDSAKKVLIEELNQHRGKFDLLDFENIIQAIDITKGVPGVYVEIGVFKGDSARLVLNYHHHKKISRKAYFFDLFEGFTNESSKTSNDGTWLNTHTDTSIEFVKQYLSGFNDFELLKLDIVEDNLPEGIKEISICNIDVDIYEAVKVALEKVFPLMAKGGIIILEDQGHTPFLAGALLATNEFLESDSAKNFIPIHLDSGQMFLIKN